MKNHKRLVPAVAVLLAIGGCHGDYLTGGELTNDPNRPTTATAAQDFVGIQSDLWKLWGSDAAREPGILAQQFNGAARQYGALGQNYAIDATYTNGLHAGLYTGGGLVDIVKLQNASRTLGDTTFLGIAQVLEGAVMGTGADLFGDLVYSQALSGAVNPKIDDQLAVYDSVQKVLSAGITNLAVAASTTNVGPGAADLVYGGSAAKWTAMAHTLKARFYMHTGEVKPAAYALALAEAKLGIKSNAGNYFGAFTANTGEQNFWFQFQQKRAGDLVPGTTLDSLLKARNDPRRALYFAHNSSDAPTNISATRLASGYQQPFVTYDENTLIWAEAAYRTGDEPTALAKLNEERANNGLAAENVSGQTLLNEILLEEYIADFQLGAEAWNLYKRTCTPNLAPPATANGLKMPRRLFYDTSELNTNTNYPAAGQGINGYANRDDPANATSDGTGAACKNQ